MKRQNRVHLPSLALGALLVLFGVVAGRLSEPKAAIAQLGTEGAAPLELLMGGKPGICTQSADGKTLYVWGKLGSVVHPSIAMIGEVKGR